MLQRMMTIEENSDLEKHQKQKTLWIPDTMRRWPWSRAINPYYIEVSAESKAWFTKFSAFNKRFHSPGEWETGLLAALLYPIAPKEHLRLGCDLIYLLAVIEEYTDFKPEPVVRSTADIIIDVLHNPQKPRPEGEIILGQIAKEFWERALEMATPTSAKHFMGSLTDFVESNVVQARGRESENDMIQTVDEYFHYRRENIGARPAYFPGEMGLNIPDEAFYDPLVKEMEYLITDMTVLDNDIVSYNREQAAGDDQWNIVTVAMQQFKFDIDSAMKWVRAYHHNLEDRFIHLFDRVPPFGPDVDKDLRKYIEHLANCARGHDCWAFESRRYFGDKGSEVQRTRRVLMLPKVDAGVPLKGAKDSHHRWIHRLVIFAIGVSVLSMFYQCIIT